MEYMDDSRDLYCDLDITDNELITENPEYVIKKGGLIGKIVALILGVVLGFIACAGTVLAMLNFTSVGYGMDLLSPFTGLTFDDAVESNLIAKKYNNKSILQLAADAALAAGAETLEELNEIFPILGEYVGSLTDDAKEEFGVDLNKDKLLSTPLGEMTTYVGDTVKNTPIGSMLKASNRSGKLDPMLLEICYGEENETYTFNIDGEIEMIAPHEPLTIMQLSNDPNKAFERVSLASVLSPSVDDSLMLSVAYGQENVTYEIVPNAEGKKEVKMLPLFLTINEEGEFVDYLDKPIVGKVTDLENGYFEIIEYRKDANGNAIMKNGAPVVKRTYYVKNDGTGTYYAYNEPKADAEPALFKKTLISDLQDDSDALIDTILLADALGLEFKAGQEDPHNILLSLAYGQEGIDYKIVGSGDNREIVMLGDSKPRTIGELKDRGNDLINDILLSDIMQEKRDDAITMYLLYGKEGLHYEFTEVLDENGNVVLDGEGNPVTEVSMKERFIYISADNNVYNEYGEIMQKRSETVSGYELDTTAGTFTDRFDNVYQYQAADPAVTEEMEDGVSAEKYYLHNEDGAVRFEKTDLGDLARSDNPIANLTKHLTISEILGEEAIADNKFLKHLGNETVDSLPQAVESLTVVEVFGEDMYLVAGSNYVDANGVEVKEGDYVDIDGNYVTPENRVMDGTWEFMLTDAGGNFCDDYTLAGDMNRMIENLDHNVKTHSMRELDKKGLMEFDDSMLDRQIIGEVKGISVDFDTDKTYVGDLTTFEMLDYLNELLSVVDTLNATP